MYFSEPPRIEVNENTFEVEVTPGEITQVHGYIDTRTALAEAQQNYDDGLADEADLVRLKEYWNHGK